MKDFLGRELDVFDEVVFKLPGHRPFVTGTIDIITPEEIHVVYINTWNYGLPGLRFEHIVKPEDLILVSKFGWPNVRHSSHKNVRSSDASTFDLICDDCGATDSVTGGWGSLRKPCTKTS